MFLKKKINKRIILLNFLKFRIIFFVTILFLLLYSNYKYYYEYISYSQDWIYKYFFGIRYKYEIINNIIEKILIIADGKLNLLLNSLWLTFVFVISIFIIKLIFDILLKKRRCKTLITFLFIEIFCFIYCFIIRKFTIFISCLIVFIVISLYIMDFILFNNFKLLKSKYKNILNIFLILSIGEVFFTPLYIKFIKSLNFRKLAKGASFIVKNVHFYLLIFIIIFLLSSFESSYINYANPFGNFHEYCGEAYSLEFSENTSTLFHDNGELIIGTAYNANNSKVIYTGKKRVISEIFAINDLRGEIYILDDYNSLKIVDINNYSIKSEISIDKHNLEKMDSIFYDNMRMVSSKDYLFLIDDGPFFVHKIDLEKRKVIKQKRIKTLNGEIIYNKNRNVLYTVEWSKDHFYEMPYGLQHFIYELDGESLEILRKIPVPLSSWDIELSDDGKKLFCALPFESFLHSSVYVFDTNSTEVIDKIDVPLGTRAIALDDERQLLLAGSPATGLIDLIDLKSKKTIKTYKAGDFSMREIVLDKKRRNFYVSTAYFGVFKGSY